MSDQMPIVFLPSGISRIIPHTNLDSKDGQLVENYYNHGYSLKDRSATRSVKNENTPGNGASSDTEMADESGEFLPEMTIDDDDEQLSDDNDKKNKGISPTPSNSGAGANAKTLKVYQSHVRVFKDWLKLEGLPTDFEYCSAEELSSWLKKFYRDGKRKDGQQWKPSSLKIFRFAINQHLNSDPFNRSMSITKDQQFKEANNVIKERQKELIQLGEDATGTRESRESARPMTAEDVRQLFQRNIVGVSNPKALHRYVFMILGINFGITTRLALHLLKPSMLEFKVDENSGLTYVLYDPKKDKSLNKTLQKPKRKMYGVPGNPMCPITALKLYIQKRNPECTEAFFHTPNRHYKETGVWYTPQATGKNTLGRLMKDIAAEGKLSFPYTNHSLRYTPPYIFTPPDPRTTEYRISGDKIVSLNGENTLNGKPSYIDTSSYNLLNIKPKGGMDSAFSSGIPYKAIVQRPAVTNSTTSERIPLLYPPINNSAACPVSSDTATSHMVKVITEKAKDESFPLREPMLESRPNSTSTTRPIKAHHVLCVSKQWDIEDIIKALNSGEAIILSKQSLRERATANHEPQTQHSPANPTNSTGVVVKNEAAIHNDIDLSCSMKTSVAQKLSARPGRKQLEPKRIRPDEAGGDSFQIEVAYDDAVTSIQANLTLIKQLQKSYPPSKQTIDELFKVRKILDRLLTEL